MYIKSEKPLLFSNFRREIRSPRFAGSEPRMARLATGTSRAAVRKYDRDYFISSFSISLIQG